MSVRLPQNYVPVHYDLYIRYFKKQFPFPASVTITYKKNQDSDSTFLIVSNNIIIKNVTQNDIKLNYNWKFPQLKIIRSKNPDQDISSYPIKIDYEVLPAFYNKESPVGKRKMFYQFEDSFLTSFEPDYTPTLLPCFDDPIVRSSFTVKIRIPSDLTGISNMPVQNSTTFGDEKEITFQPTPPMCCYLLSIFVGPFNGIAKNTKYGTPVILYSNHLDPALLLYYLQISVFALEWFESKMGVKYELPHLQLLTYEGIGLGMENYGLIALSDVSKCTDSNPNSNVIQNALTVMHEIAHLWFGDLVSIKWWDSIWLNEGFAQYFECLVLKDCLNQDADAAIQIFIKYFGTASLAFFDNEKLVYDESEIDLTKDVIRIHFYVKGAFVLKMFSDIIGEENFLKICSVYLATYKNQSVEVSDFLAIVNKTMGKDYSADYFDVWLNQIGYPLLKVTELSNEKDELIGVKITQHSISESIFKFKIQILYGINDETKKIEVMINKAETVIDAKFDWIIVNYDFHSLCMVVYSKLLLERLIGIKDKISKINKDLIFLSSDFVKEYKDKFGIDGEILEMCNVFDTNKKKEEEKEYYISSDSSDDDIIYTDGTNDDQDDVYFDGTNDDQNNFEEEEEEANDVDNDNAADSNVENDGDNTNVEK